MSYQTVDPSAARDLLESADGPLYLDVRSEQEFAAGHPPGAYNIPLLFRGPGGMEPNPDFVAQVQRHFPADTAMVLGCAAGMRSARACELLAQQGYGSLWNMDGGFSGRMDPSGQVQVEGWAARGLPVAAEPEAGRSFADLS